MDHVIVHGFGLALALAVLVELVAATALAWTAATVVRRRASRAGGLLFAAALIELALASLCCVRAEGTGAVSGPWASRTDDGLHHLLDVLAIGTPLLHGVALVLVVLAVRSLATETAAPR